jgi:putative OPT family oligopeptide transporter
VTETQTSTAASTGGSSTFVPPRGELTPQAIIAAVIVAGIMGASYPYMVLKLGFGPNVSVVAAFFGFIILNVIGRRTYDRWQNNIVQTAGTSAAQTAFMCVLLGAFDMLRDQTAGKFSIVLEPYQAFIWLSIAGMLGVLLAVPLRRHFIVDEKLPFADGVAAAETLIVLDPPKSGAVNYEKAWAAARAAAKALGIGVLLSGLLMVVRDDSKMLGWVREGWDPETWHITAAAGIVTFANMGVGVSYSLLSIGSGMLIGLRINVSMMLGGLLSWVIIPYFLINHGVISSADPVTHQITKTQVLYWIMWPATGMLVAGGLAALALRWRLLIDTFRSLRGAKINSSEFPISWVVGGVGGCSVLLCVVQYVMLGMSPLYTVAAIILSIPLMLVGLRVLGETNWGPISALSNMMQGVFALVAPGNVAANMTASGTTGTIATSSEAIMQDFKAGDMIGSTPRAMTLAQLIAVPIGAAAVAWTYPALVKTYGIIGPKAQLQSPISRKWAGFAQLLQDGFGSIAPSALWAMVIFAVLGIIFTVLESNKKIRTFVPSPTGIGIGMLVPFAVIATMFLGGVIGTIWAKADKRSSDHYMIPLASGFIAGEALIAVIVPVLIWLGFAYGFPVGGG